jgi:hypothetical protein
MHLEMGLSRRANVRLEVDAGWRDLLVFQRPWPRVTHAGCYPEHV